jgi:glycosyltransferase involved in cell wall biosynthesis
MQISVVIANYNYGKYLGRCVRSILSQSIDRKIYEVVIVDDASTDDSLAIMNTFSTEVRVIENQANMGLAYTANVGITSAKGRYVVRLDSDDYVHADFLRTLLIGFEFFGKQAEAISTDYLKVTPVGEILSYGFAEIEPIACSIAFKMDALETLGFYNDALRIGEEVELRERFDSANFRIRNVNLPLYRYVQHSKSLTKSVLI